MGDSNANPFDSQSLGDTAETSDYNSASGAAKTPFRWIGLSTLSGVLLFTSYFVAATAILFLASAFLFVGLPDQRILTALGLNCLAAGIYGGLVGATVGCCLGIVAYGTSESTGPWWTFGMGIPMGVIFSILLPLSLHFGFSGQMSSEYATYFLVWISALGLFATIASGHLAYNIRRFLILPAWEARLEQ